MLTLERAKELNGTRVTEEHLILHAKNVSYAMGAMARHFGQDPEHWERSSCSALQTGRSPHHTEQVWLLPVLILNF